jgi:hypothetical protein
VQIRQTHFLIINGYEKGIPSMAGEVEHGRTAVTSVLRNGSKQTSRGFFLLLLWGALAGFCLIVLQFDAMQPRGILFLDYFLNINILQRLIPLLALGLGEFAFAITVRETKLALRAASLPSLIERHWRAAAWLSIGAGIAGALAVVWVLRAFPNSGDEYDYLFEAKTFLAGRLWNPVPPLSDLFWHFHILFENGKWVAGYPPGWPLLLAAVIGLRLPPWLACPLAGGLLLLAVFKLGQRRDGALGGVLAVAAVAVSPFFLFNAGSYFDMVPATAAGLLFVWAGLAFLDQPRLSNATAAGVALGVLGLMRVQDVILFALPFAVEFLWRARRRHYCFTFVIILAGLPFLAVLLFYYHAVFGSLLPQVNLESPTLRFGLFPVDEAGNHLTPFDELHFLGARLVMLAEWSSPLLVLCYYGALRSPGEHRRLSFPDFIFPMFVIGFMIVPFGGGNQYGPRYYFEGFPFLVLTVASALTPLLRDARRPRKRAFFTALAMAHAATCLAATAIFAVSMRTIIDQRMDIYDQVKAERLRNAVVVIHNGTSPLRPMDPGDLTRNGITADKSIIYVLDIPNQLQKLHQLFPDRRFYLYERDPSSPRGILRSLCDSAGAGRLTGWHERSAKRASCPKEGA